MQVNSVPSKNLPKRLKKKRLKKFDSSDSKSSQICLFVSIYACHLVSI